MNQHQREHAGPRGVRRLAGGAVLAASCLALADPPSTSPRHDSAAAFTEQVPGTAVSFEMVPIDGGTVTLEVNGSPQTVEIGTFWIARTEVTWDLYDVYVFAFDEPQPTGDEQAGEGDGGGQDDDEDPGAAAESDTADPPENGEEVDAVTRPSQPYVSPDRGYGHTGFAAISLSYHGAAQFCHWLSTKTGRRYRLPTEAEWRLVCERSGIDADSAAEHAWFEDNADFTTHPVASRKPDALGLSDLWGNVREWCTGVDGEPVALGGSFIDARDGIGCGGRAVPAPDWQMTDPQVPKSIWWLSDADFVGFRVICEPEPVAPAGNPPDRPQPPPSPDPPQRSR